MMDSGVCCVMCLMVLDVMIVEMVTRAYRIAGCVFVLG